MEMCGPGGRETREGLLEPVQGRKVAVSARLRGRSTRDRDQRSECVGLRRYCGGGLVDRAESGLGSRSGRGGTRKVSEVVERPRR